MKVFFFLLLAATFLFGQGDTTSNNSQYIMEEFTLPGGQLFNNVNCITEGPYGFLWFATHGGVVRYDGYEFVTFTANPADTIAPTTSLTFPYTEHLYWDKYNMLWVSSYGGGLFRFDPATETFDHFEYDEDDPTTISFPRVMWVQEDVDGRLWITTEHGINRFDRETETFKRYYPFEGTDNLRDNTFRNIYLDNRGTLWVSGGNAPWQSNISGLLKYDKSTDSFIKYVHDPDDPTTLSSSSTRGLLEDRNGNFWVGNSVGLQQMDRDQGTFTSYNYSESHPYAPGEESGINSIAFSLLEDQEGALWVGSMSQIDKPSNLLKYDPVTQTVTNFPLRRSAWDLHQSKDGTLWVAGAGISGKVTRIKPKSKIYELSKSPNYVEAYNQVRQEIQKGNRRLGSGFYTGMGLATFGFDQTTGIMWGTHVGAYGTVVGGGEATPILSSYDPESKELSFYHLPELNLTRDNTLPGNIRGVTGLAVDQLGRVWSSNACENVGLFCFDPKTEKVVQYLHDPEDSTSLSSNFVIDIYQDPQQGDLYVSTYDREINRVNTITGEIKRIDVTNIDLLAYDNNPLTATWHEGDIWIAGDIGSGDTDFIVKYNPDTEEKEWIPIPGLSPTGWIQDMDWTAGCEYIAFVSGDNGIGYIDPFNYQVNLLNTTNGLFPNDDTRAVLMTEDDIAIFSTEAGEYILHYPSGEIETIQKTNANRGSLGDGARAPDGKLYFNTIDGSWDVIDPAIIQSGSSINASNLALVDLYVLGEKQVPSKGKTLSKPLWMTDKVSLGHTAENFALRFSDFNYRGGNTSYLYRLYPYEDWHTTTGSPIANYYKVPAGDYEFQIKSLNSSDDADNTALSLKLTILPPWWRTWWAYLGYVLLGGLSIGYLVKYQRERAIQLERERIKDRELEQAKKLEVAYNKLKESEREAQIEASLERVRAASMGMQRSEDLKDVVSVLYREIAPLGLATSVCTIHTFHEDTQNTEVWVSDGTEANHINSYFWYNREHSVIDLMWNQWEKGESYLDIHLKGEEKKDLDQYLLTKTDYKNYPDELKDVIKGADEVYFTCAYFCKGFIASSDFTEPSKEQKDILYRFVKVFDQTYTRFLDLQKAEAQAREAQIEAALERVRAAGMAMHQSSELAEVVVLLLGQLRILGLPLSMCFINIVRRKSKQIETWITFEGDLHPQVVNLPLEEYIKLENKSLALNRDTDFISFKLNDDLLIEYNQGLANLSGDDVFISQEFPAFRDTLLSTMSYGSIGICTDNREMPSEARQVLPRFAKVFDQTYTRFLDLQKAEAQAREAQIEVALERVRSRSMAMQNSSESMDLVLVLFDQIKEVGIAIESSWITLVDKDSSSLEFWVRHGDQVADAYIIDANDHPNIQATLQAHKDHVDIIHIPNPKHDFIATAKQLFGFEVQDRPDKTVFHLLQIRHRYGYIGLGTWEESTDQETILCRRFTNVFEQTYTRFLDLKKSEAQAKAIRDERDRLDATLSELQATQAQLIQAEKMASLGELTAGIAHEIQNPLNFVNNFSEVSGELIDEALEEIDTDPDEAKDILSDLKTNLEKINHHGKRADSIVKGMLQHSRSDTGEKVPTDINALCDEYMRLAYHGLRAKDKSFNADYELNLDDQIGKVNVVPQDMSRVILNIITNAFQACTERERGTHMNQTETEVETAYAPKVICTTKLSPLRGSGGGRIANRDGSTIRGEKARNKVTITISDNGPGIPDDIKEKIFQPFFTTKPTGQGTGLGLSMAYDIVKAHGGNLDIESKVGIGTTFIIELPITR